MDQETAKQIEILNDIRSRLRVERKIQVNQFTFCDDPDSKIIEIVEIQNRIEAIDRAVADLEG